MKVKVYVHVRGDRGQSALLAPGDTVPDWADVTNPDVIEADAKILPAPAPEPKDDEDEDAAPAAEDTPEPAPAPRKRAARKAADS